MDLFLGGFSAVLAGIFTNPLEVVKIRMQLQGELQAKGNYQIHYRNIFHGAYTIGKNEGIFALQKGLVPALYFQFVINGLRLGIYDILNKSVLRNADGSVPQVKRLFAAAFTGTVGAIAASPFFLIKTQLQSQSSDNISVGTQHKHQNMTGAFRSIYSKYGIRGLWQGTSSSIPRIAIGSAVQLSTFEVALDFTQKTYKMDNRWLNVLAASFISGVVVAGFMNPFDLIATRFYNQEYNKQGKGITYKSVTDCAIKIWKKEGISGFYKGLVPHYFRIGPHTLLNLMFWDQLKYYYQKCEIFTVFKSDILISYNMYNLQ
ncbi:unnamed protein product [Allacma fusca]|uniref:Solute carrier family 25 member 35 n=1 Tax=Allacma fusca TaxID=39272 RepID=A0A8J2NX86_9HEXA|nr:unnamed protein product [Allacma fusca]